MKQKIKFVPVEHLSQVLKQALLLPGHTSARGAHGVPPATSLIANEKPVKEPAAVM